MPEDGYLYQFMDTVGDGTGSFNAAVDGSETPVVFKIKPRDGELKLLLHRLIVYIEDEASSFTTTNYGSISTLSNGIAGGIYSDAGDALQIISGGFVVKSMGNWSALCYDAEPLQFGFGNDAFRVRWTFTKAGQPLTIRSGEYFGLVIRDDLSDLAAHTFMMQGIRVYDWPSYNGE